MKGFIFCNLVVALILLLLGLIGILVLPQYVEQGIVAMRELTSAQSPMYASWVNPVNVSDQLLKVTIFNVTNYAEIEKDASVAPILTSRGPYIYETTSFKDESSISWSPEGIVQYKYHKRYAFRADLSGNHTESDDIISVNFPVIAVVGFLNGLDPETSMNMWSAMEPTFQKAEKSMYIKNKVSDLLWHLKDPTVEALGISASPLTNDDPKYFKDFSKQHAGVTSHVLNYTANDSLGYYAEWAGAKSLSIWGSAQANMINGTDGSIFHADVKETDVLPIFSEQLLRTINLSFKHASSDFGVPLKCFHLEPSQLLNEQKEPLNAPFGIKETGFLSLPGVSTVAFSKPYFLDADLSNVHVAVDGQNPPKADDATHDTVLCVEPKTGLTMKANRRIQINARMSELKVWVKGQDGKLVQKVIEFSKGTPDTWVPFIYAEDYVAIKQTAADDLRMKVYSPLFLGIFGGIACLVLSGVFLLIALLLYISHRRECRRRSILHAGLEKDPLINITR